MWEYNIHISTFCLTNFKWNRRNIINYAACSPNFEPVSVGLTPQMPNFLSFHREVSGTETAWFALWIGLVIDICVNRWHAIIITLYTYKVHDMFSKMENDFFIRYSDFASFLYRSFKSVWINPKHRLRKHDAISGRLSKSSHSLKFMVSQKLFS